MKKINSGLKSAIVLSLVVVLTITSILASSPTKVKAASELITREGFIALVMKELEFTVEGTSSAHPYMDAAIRAGIISKSTFGTKYNDKLTKSDAAVVLVNAHEFLYGNTLEDSLVTEIMEKRISDIESVAKARRIYIAKAFAYGYLKGNSNGDYSTNRNIKAWQKISVTTAKSLVAMLTDESKRSQIAPDGQLIRTTKLPSNADMYPYILASYPNKYYDWEFYFMKGLVYVPLESKPGWEIQVPQYTTKSFQDNKLKSWASPKDVKMFNQGEKIWFLGDRYVDTKEVVELGLDEWVEKTKTYLMAAFNINYKTIAKDTEWYNTILSLDCEYQNDLSQKRTEEYIKKYIDAAIDNKTIIECDKVAVDGSTLYYSRGLTLRCYVRYRVISAKDTSTVRMSPLAFTKYRNPDYTNIVLGEWRNGYFDINVSPSYGRFNIEEIVISDIFHNTKVVE